MVVVGVLTVVPGFETELVLDEDTVEGLSVEAVLLGSISVMCFST